MKNEQKNDQRQNDQTKNRGQDQNARNTTGSIQSDQSQIPSDLSQQRGGIQSQSKQPPGNEKSNINVNNEDKIEKDEQWNNDNNNRNNDQRKNTDQQKDKQVRSDKTVTEPEIDAPIYDPEKTEKKIPQMGSNK